MLVQQFHIFSGLLFYFLSLVLSFLLISPKNINRFIQLKYVLPVFFLLIVSLYVLPLPFYSYSFKPPSGNISPQLYSFVKYIPWALLLSAIFNLTFSFSYRKLFLKKQNKTYSVSITGLSTVDLAIVYSIFVLSLWLIYQLSKSAGGLIGLILSGYGVTELFIGKGHYAVGFQWIITISLLLWGNVLISGKKHKIYLYGIILLILSSSFVIMGRRASLIILVGSAIFLFHNLYKPIKFSKLILIGIFGFYSLTLIGFLRGDSYENFGNLIDKIQNKKERIDDNKSKSYFYAVTTGNFAVPFETFPQVIKSFGYEYTPGLGTYSLSPLANTVPSSLWKNRPIPLANWYMKTYYGESQANIGRQFFFLSAPFMDFGPLGIFLFGILVAVFWGKIQHLATKHKNDILAITFVALIVTSILNIVSTDFTGWIVAFSKGYGLPIIVLFFKRRLFYTYNKIIT